MAKTFFQAIDDQVTRRANRKVGDMEDNRSATNQSASYDALLSLALGQDDYKMAVDLLARMSGLR